MSPADKRWIRKMVREEVKTILHDVLAAQVQQIGGYDGATPVIDEDVYESRRRIGFTHTQDVVSGA